MEDWESLTSIDVEMEPSLDADQVPDESVLDKAFRIPLIFENIAKSLNAKDLKKCRLVSLNWRENATEYLIKKDCLQTNISTPSLDSSGHLKLLNDCLLKSVRFPCTDFTLRGPLNPFDFSQFFSLIGPTIKTLSLANTGNLSSKRKIRKIFKGQIRNVKRLKLLENINFNWNDKSRFCLATLKHLSLSSRFSEHDQTVEKILLSAEGLQSLDNVTSSWFHCLAKLDKIHLVQVVKWIRLDTETNIQGLVDFANAQPRLQKCVSCSLWTRGVETQPSIEHQNVFVESLLKILTSSSDTLEELELTPLPYGQTQNEISFPQLKKVKSLRLKNSYNSNWPMFPRTCNLNFSFPHVETLDLHWFHEWKQLLPLGPQHPTKQLSSVRNIECGDDLDELAIRKVQKLCPNVQKFKIYASSNLDTLLPNICDNWPLLKSLEMVEVPPYHYVSWDAALTGFSEDVCRRNMGEISDRRINERFPRRSWIGNLTNLKNLDIYLHASNLVRDGTPLRLTSLSGLYAFQFVPNVHVRILSLHGNEFSLCMKEALKSVAPFVHAVDN